MDSAAQMMEQDRQVAETIARERSRLWKFIRNRMPSQEDAEDILQEVFFELVEAYRLMKPVEKVGAWMLRVARNRITDWFRRKRPASLADAVKGHGGDEAASLEDLLPAPGAGPEARYARAILIDELVEALDELPEEQRAVFWANEVEGRSFAEIAAQTGENINTLLSRKRYAVLRLRRRLQRVYDEFRKG